MQTHCRLMRVEARPGVGPHAEWELGHGATYVGSVSRSLDGHVISARILDGVFSGLNDQEAVAQAEAWHAEAVADLIEVRDHLREATREVHGAGSADPGAPLTCTTPTCGGDSVALRAEVVALLGPYSSTYVTLNVYGDGPRGVVLRGTDPEPFGTLRRRREQKQWEAIDSDGNVVGGAERAVAAMGELCAEAAVQDLHCAERMIEERRRWRDGSLRECIDEVIEHGRSGASDRLSRERPSLLPVGATPLRLRSGPEGRWHHVYRPDGVVGLARPAGPGEWSLHLGPVNTMFVGRLDEAARQLNVWHGDACGQMADRCAEAAAAVESTGGELFDQYELPWQRQATSGCLYDAAHDCDSWETYAAAHLSHELRREYTKLLGMVHQIEHPPKIANVDGNGAFAVRAAGVTLGTIRLGEQAAAQAHSTSGVNLGGVVARNPLVAQQWAIGRLYEEHVAGTVREEWSDALSASLPSTAVTDAGRGVALE